MERCNRINLPIYELDSMGSVKANPLFHRAWDKLHSRCIEYPFAASNLGNAKCLLDVGSTKSGSVWISWLESLPIEVHSTDYDPPTIPFKNVIFHQQDIRQLDIDDNTFDKIFAVSVIEHIGLDNPQVVASAKPRVAMNGDLEAVHELKRVLRPGGELIMTLPFGKKEKLISNNTSRVYTNESLRKFSSLLSEVKLEYYEYQYNSKPMLYEDYPTVKNILRYLLKGFMSPKELSMDSVDYNETPGAVVWRNIPLSEVSAMHKGHIDGVICGIWKKEEA